MKKLFSFLFIMLLLFASCNDSGQQPSETTPGELTAGETTAPEIPESDVYPDVPEFTLTEKMLRSAYDKAARCYALFTGFACPEMGRGSIEVDGNQYDRVSEFADMEALRVYTRKFFDDALTEQLLTKTTVSGAPLYIEQNGALYRFGGYVGLWSYDAAEITSFSFAEKGEDQYTLTITAEVDNNGSFSAGSFTYGFTVEDGNISFTSFALMSELIWNSMLVMRPAYTEAGMLEIFPEEYGPPLFAHKIFTSRIYIFPVIEKETFTLYYAEDYVSDSPAAFKQAVIDIPEEYDYDSITPLSASAGGGSGECLLYVRLTEGGENRYLVLYAYAGSAYDDSGSFTMPLTFRFEWECDLADVIFTGYSPDKTDVGAKLALTIESGELNSLLSNLCAPELAGWPMEITFSDLPDVKITGHLHESNGAPYADCIIVSSHALLFDEAPEPLYGNFSTHLFRADGVTVFDKLYYYVGDSYLFTDAGIVEFHEDTSEGDTAISFFARTNENAFDGDPATDDIYDLCYYLHAKKYNGRFAQLGDMGVLEVCTGEDDLCYEVGRVNVDGGSLSFVPEAIYPIGSLYDLDATFEKARRQGLYAQFDTPSDLYTFNKSKKNE